MENTSKAVIMAGGVLIAVAVISLALYAYNVFKDYTESSEQLFTLTQIESFNRFYQSFSEGNDTIRGVDAINLYNKAMDDGLENSNCEIPDILKNYMDEENPTENFLETYDYKIKYDTQGRVSGFKIQ